MAASTTGKPAAVLMCRAAVCTATAGDQGLLIVEVQRGSILREDDIERFADDYGRVAAPVG